MSELYLGRTISNEDRCQIIARIKDLKEHIKNVEKAMEDALPSNKHVLFGVRHTLEMKWAELLTCLEVGVFVTNTPWEFVS